MTMNNIKKFLDLIAFSEGTSTSKYTKNNGYDVIVDGVNSIGEIFTDYSQHPFANRHPKLVRSTPDYDTWSTASGRYQILLKTYRAYTIQLNLKDFSPHAQDCIAVELIRERFPLDQLDEGLIPNAIHACSKIWASFPGNQYNQGGKSLETLMSKWEELSIV